MYKGYDLSDIQIFNAEQEENYYYERDRLAHLDMQAGYQQFIEDYEVEGEQSMSKMSDIDIAIRNAIVDSLDILNSTSSHGEEIAHPVSFLQDVLLNDPTFCNIIPCPVQWINDILRDYQYMNEQGCVAYQLLGRNEETYPQDFDLSPRNAGYEEPEPEHYEEEELSSLEGPFPTLAECDEEIRLAINEHPF